MSKTQTATKPPLAGEIAKSPEKSSTHLPAMPRPTEAELAILQVLWAEGPSTVRAVFDALNIERPTGYTTVLKLLQIMHEKGLVERDESQRSHVYRPARPAEHTRRKLVGDLIDRAFGGSAHELVLQALSARPASPEELAELRLLLKSIEGGRRS